jgi:MinD-like ATPase involved in chromosome partitioning or flagellar assembly
LSGGSGIEELANLTAFDLERIISKLNLCENLADIILIDTGAGLSKSVLNFLMAADDVILVTTPEPTAMTDVYAIMKAYSNQPDCSEVKLVVNRVTEPNEGIDVQAKLEKTALRFLNLNVTTLGEIKEDRNLVRAVKAQRPVVLSYPNSDVAKCIKKIASVLISDDTDKNFTPQGPSARISSTLTLSLMRFNKLYFALAPKTIFTFAIPKSASMMRTRYPICDKAIAKFTDKFVLPTPPLPLLTAITLDL